MTRRTGFMLVAILTLAAGNENAFATDSMAGVCAGFNGGPSVRVSTGVSNFAESFPLAFEFGIGYSTRDPGDAFAARRVFIADAANGTPEKNGTLWDFRMDFLYNIRVSGFSGLFLFSGIRYSMFDAHFRYVGANEEFDVTTNQWGIGGGAKAEFPISRKVNLVVSGGLDFFFNGTFEGHDSRYFPNNMNENPKENFTYADAQRVINEPKVLPILLIGLNYSF